MAPELFASRGRSKPCSLFRGRADEGNWGCGWGCRLSQALGSNVQGTVTWGWGQQSLETRADSLCFLCVPTMATKQPTTPHVSTRGGWRMGLWAWSQCLPPPLWAPQLVGRAHCHPTAKPLLPLPGTHYLLILPSTHRPAGSSDSEQSCERRGWRPRTTVIRIESPLGFQALGGWGQDGEQDSKGWCGDVTLALSRESCRWRWVEFRGPSPQRTGRCPAPGVPTACPCCLHYRASEGACPIPSALEATWGQGALAQRGAAVDGPVHSWGKEEKKASYVRGGG